MNLIEHTNIIQQFGYTAREAEFIVTVALHSGYFLMRQFSSYGGKVANRFGKKVVAWEHAKVRKFASNTSLYHLNSKALYRAIGQENNRHRRAHESFQVRSKVMGLDYVLAHPNHRFLPTEQDKLAYFCGERNIPESVLPTKTYAGKGGNTKRFFVDKYPIRIDPATGKVTFCFVDDVAFSGLGFETWLAQYDAISRAIRDAEVVFVSTNPTSFEPARKQFQRQYSTHEGVSAAQLLAYFEMRKNLEATGFRGVSITVLDNFKKLRKTFSDAKFEEKYKAWANGSLKISADTSVVFSTYHLECSYSFLRSSIG